MFNENTVREDAPEAEAHVDPRIDFFQPLNPTHFPATEGLKPQVEFWKKIFTEYTSRQAVIHDRRHVSIIYTVIDLNERQVYSDRARKKTIRSALKKYKRMLRRLKKLKPEDIETLSEDEKRVFHMIKEAPGNYRFNRAGRNFRVQYGLKDSFQKALVNSTPYLKEMERIFAENGLPVELTRLPFAESSFNVEAHSLAGAAGIWQFTRSTGKNYMKIDRFIDERRDPLKSTEAAAKLLSFYYRQFKSWPLAITAYNHGSYAMKKAVRKTKSRDLETIINTYKGRTFGFSSRNYYVEFLAILEILKDYSQYFDAIEFLPPEKYDEFILEDYIKMKTLLKYSSLEDEVIARLNPELRKSVLRSRRFLPKHYPLRIPSDMKEKIEKEYAMIASTEKRSHINVIKTHRVKYGQNLHNIAKMYATSVKAIVRANSIKNPNMLSKGQVLKIPTQI
jgi:membrane-bound lytic murein transglycosylase D